MKQLSLIIGIPVVTIALIIGGVVIWRQMQPPAPAPTGTSRTLPSGFLTDGGAKPASPFNVSTATSGVAATPTPASAAAMNADLQTVTDDGGTADFTALQQEASGL